MAASSPRSASGPTAKKSNISTAHRQANTATRRTDRSASAPSDSDGEKQRERSTQQRAREAAQSRLDHMNSSTDVEELADQRREAAAVRRRSKDVQGGAAHAKTPPVSAAVETPRSSRSGASAARPSPPREDEMRSQAATKDASAGAGRGGGGGGGGGGGAPAASNRQTKQRQGTGKWASGGPSSSLGSSSTHHSDDDAASTQDKSVSSTLIRKRGGTGRWSADERRRLTEEAVTVNVTVGTGTGAGKAAKNTAADGVGGSVSCPVLARSLALAEKAWLELANHRECGMDDIAHESQVVVDEGDHDQVRANPPPPTLSIKCFRQGCVLPISASGRVLNLLYIFAAHARLSVRARTILTCLFTDFTQHNLSRFPGPTVATRANQ
jgi:hypothetical protein